MLTVMWLNVEVEVGRTGMMMMNLMRYVFSVSDVLHVGSSKELDLYLIPCSL